VPVANELQRFSGDWFVVVVEISCRNSIADTTILFFVTTEEEIWWSLLLLCSKHDASSGCTLHTLHNSFQRYAVFLCVCPLNSLGTCVFIASCVSKKTWNRILMTDFACPLCKICKVCLSSDLVMHPCVA
jgi:hypothetical protein